MGKDTDHLGRPIVVVTGMGVHDVPGAGAGGQLAGADQWRFRAFGGFRDFRPMNCGLRSIACRHG